MLERLFTSRTRVNILNLFYASPEKEFYLREIARLTGENPNGVAREAKNLVELNILQEGSRGYLRVFSINRNSSIFEEMKEIFLRTEGALSLLRQEIKTLNGVRYALVYGAFAKRLKTDEIDLLLVGEANGDAVAKTVSVIAQKVGRKVYYMLWSEGDYRSKMAERDPMLISILSSATIQLVGSAEELKVST
jgi:predicted transcriptional regulator with HTH domain